MTARTTTQRAFHAMCRRPLTLTSSTFIPLMPLSSSTSGFTTSFHRNHYSCQSLRNLCTKPHRPSSLPGRPGSGKVIAMAAVDLKFIRDNVELVRENINNRSVSADVDQVVKLYDELVKLSTQTDNIRSKRNSNASLMKKAGKMTPEERTKCIEEGKQLKSQLITLEQTLTEIETKLQLEASRIPNLTHPDVPVGDESNATILSTVGDKKQMDVCRSHLDLLQMNDWADFESAAKVVGNKFYYLKNDIALLELALVQWAMTTARKNNFTVMTTPDVAREEVIAACGFQPRGESSQIYHIEDSDLCLIGTSEIALGGYYSSQIVSSKELPIRLAAFSHCFRREVGSAGAVAKGLYRVHQFSKVELFVIAHPDQSNELLDELIALEEQMYTDLGLHFKILDMPTQDLGNPAYRKFDIEAWMPGRNSYGEISSASNCTDYQARRLAIRFKDQEKGSNRYVHTLNATACAVPRIILSILETHQQEDGSVIIPEVLRPFMGGIDRIGGGEQAAEYMAENESNLNSAKTSATEPISTNV